MNDTLSNKIRQIAVDKLGDVMEGDLTEKDFETIINIYITTIEDFSSDDNLQIDYLKKEVVRRREQEGIPIDNEEMMILNSAFEHTEAYLES